MLVTTVGTYLELYYIGYFSTKQCNIFKVKARMISDLMPHYNIMKFSPSVPCYQ